MQVNGDPTLSRRGYFYTPPILFAVREGHVELKHTVDDFEAIDLPSPPLLA